MTADQEAIMDIIDYFSIVERNHAWQNPTTAEKLDLLIDYCGFRDGDRILDIGCGKGWLLQRIAERYAVRADGIDMATAFIGEGGSRIASARLRGSIALHRMPASEFKGPHQAYDACLCIGASFAIGSFEQMFSWLRKYLRPGGVMAIGDVYARKTPLPKEAEEAFSGGAVRTLQDTIEILERDGMNLIGLIDSSVQDWDHYESLHWQVADAWMRDHENHPERNDFQRMSVQLKREYLSVHRDNLGWAIFVGRDQSA
jgi:cyclopropane fatty-acyl-phospholipid synthase-like methyltransferase